MLRKISRSFFLFSTLAGLAAMSGCSASTSPTSSGGGNGKGGILALPNPVDFGTIGIGQKHDSLIRISNTGSDSLTILSNVLSSPEAEDTNFGHTVGLASGGYRDVHIQFTPDAAGAQSVYDSIHYQSGGTNSIAIMTLEANMGSGGGGNGSGTLIAIPSSINFGSLSIGQPHDTAINLVNTGSSPLTITSNVLSSTEAADTNFSHPVIITPLSGITIHVQFNPAQAGARTATDSIHYTRGGTNGVTAITLTATGVSGSPSPGAGSTFTYAVDSDGVAQGDSTYTIVTNTLSYEGKTNVIEVRGPTGDLNYYHVESNGDVSFFVDLSPYSALLTAYGLQIELPSSWNIIPLSARSPTATKLFDSTITLQGIPLPVEIVIWDTGRFAGSSQVSAAGKSFQTNEGSISIAVTATASGLLNLYSSDVQSYVWYSSSLGYYPKRQDVTTTSGNTGGANSSATTATTHYLLKSYNEK